MLAEELASSGAMLTRVAAAYRALTRARTEKAHIQTASRAYTRPFWYQSRVWDPDD